jgi:hypothetical protein
MNRPKLQCDWHQAPDSAMRCGSGIISGSDSWRNVPGSSERARRPIQCAVAVGREVVALCDIPWMFVGMMQLRGMRQGGEMLRSTAHLH